MLDALYRRRLERDLELWRSRGWVSGESAEAILDSVGPASLRMQTATVFAFFGAILIAAAAVAFVAANWSEIPRPMRLGILVAGMAVCYAGAALFSRAGRAALSDAAIFAGAALFGASIGLVAQSYHISGDYPDALLLWAAGALAAAVLGPSRAALMLALVVFCLWSWYEVTDFAVVLHWPFLIAWAIVASIAIAWRWAAGQLAAILAVVGWIAVTLISLAAFRDWPPALVVCVAIVLAAGFFAGGRLVAARAGDPLARFGDQLATTGLVLILPLMMLMQPTVDARFETPADIPVAAVVILAGLGAVAVFALALAAWRGKAQWWEAAAIALAVGAVLVAAVLAPRLRDDLLVPGVALGAVVLVLAAWTVAYGHAGGRLGLARLGLVVFALEIAYLYYVTFGTLLGTAAFFLFGGVLMIALSSVLFRIERRLERRGSGAVPA